MNTTHAFPAGIAVGIGRPSRRFGRAIFALAALIVVVAVAVVTLAVRSSDSAPAAPVCRPRGTRRTAHFTEFAETVGRAHVTLQGGVGAGSSGSSHEARWLR